MSLLIAALLAATPAFCQQVYRVSRGEFQIRVKVSGTVVAADVFRLKSTIDGRVEEIAASTGAWVRKDRPAAVLASREEDALLSVSNRSTDGRTTLEQRFSSVYPPTKSFCPADCFILKTFVKPREWIKPQTALFEAALRLVLVGRLGFEDVQWVQDGQTVEVWPASDPSRRVKARVQGLEPDVRGPKGASGASFWVELPKDRFLPPGTQWEGLIIPLTKRKVLTVPTAALMEYKGSVFLPVRVSTGISAGGSTELTAGVMEGREVLVLSTASLKDAGRRKAELEAAAPAPPAAPSAPPDEARAAEARPAYVEPAPPPSPEPAPEKSKALSEPGADYGEGPYGP